MSAEHIEGLPVSGSTYANHGCRCAGCTAARTERARATRERHPNTHREQRRRLVLAARWVKKNHWKVWDEICQQAADDVAKMLKEPEL